jgi:plastocyanin
MKRREFVEKAGIGAAALATLATPGHARASAKAGAQHAHSPISGPLATATVSFGAWASGVNRFPNRGAAAGLANNVHALIPNEVQIKAGGTVNFIIAGFHLLVVYDDGTKPGDINTALTVPPTTQPVPPLINDPANRVYLGIDPSVLPFLQGPTQPGPMGPFQPVLQDRVEVVHFPNPGTFLVICGVLPHFDEGMVGYVKVNP